MTSPLPTPDSYRVPLEEILPAVTPPGRLLAGEYPGAADSLEARDKARRFVVEGVNLFLDLTEAGEYGLRPYEPDMRVVADEEGRQVFHERHPIPDMGTPSRAAMVATLDAIDKALGAGQTVYVHCFGGIGRTGTVIGCWLARHGLIGEDALARIRAWRQGTPDGWRQSPETEPQRRMVLNWRKGE